MYEGPKFKSKSETNLKLNSCTAYLVRVQVHPQLLEGVLRDVGGRDGGAVAAAEEETERLEILVVLNRGAGKGGWGGAG